MWGDENLLLRMRLAAINCAKLVPWWTQNWSSRGLWLSKMVDMIDLHNVSFPMGWTVATDKKYIQGVWVRASRYHRCSCKLLNVECMVPARDLDVGQHRTAIIHRAACAEAVLFDTAPRFDAGSPRVHLFLSGDDPFDVCIRAVCVDTLLPGQVDRLHAYPGQEPSHGRGSRRS